MQRGATDGGARQMNAFQHSSRGQHPGTTYGDLNIQQLCFFLLRRVLESNGPLGEFGGRAKNLPLVKIIYFNDSAVNIIFQIAPAFTDGVDLIQHLVKIRITREIIYRVKAQIFKIIQGLLVRTQGLASDLLNVEYKNIQSTSSSHATIFLAQRTGCRISWVLKGLFSGNLLSIHHLLKAAVRHIHLAPHLQVRQRILDFQRNAADHPQIAAHIFAHIAVASGRTTHKHAVPVFQTYGQTVDLRLHHIARVVHTSLHPTVKVSQLCGTKRILQALHTHSMGHRGKRIVRFAAHFLGGAIRGDVAWIGLLQRLQPAHHHIVLKVLNLRRVVVIILIRVVAQLLAQVLDLL